MDQNRLVKKVDNVSKENYMNKNTENWCKKIHKLIIKYNLNDLWKNENKIRVTPRQQPNQVTEQQTVNKFQLRKAWYNFLYKIVHKKEEEEWKQ